MAKTTAKTTAIELTDEEIDYLHLLVSHDVAKNGEDTEFEKRILAKLAGETEK